MKTPQPLPFPLSNVPFTVDQAHHAGVSRRRTRAPDLLTPSRGLRAHAAVPATLLNMCKALTAVSPGTVVSHVSAAQLHRLFLPSRYNDPELVDLARRFGEGRPRRRKVRGHLINLAPTDLELVGGVPTTSVQRTLLDLAPLLTVDELVIIADQIVCGHDGSCVPFKEPRMPLAALRHYIEGHAGDRGMKKLRIAMDLVRVGSDSARETQLRLLIHRSPLPDFEHNIELKNALGWSLVQPDLACQEYKTCAEYDGLHHFSAEQQAKDHERDFATRSLGWHQVLINNADIRGGEWVVITKIARMLKAGGWPDPGQLAQRPLPGRFA